MERAALQPRVLPSRLSAEVVVRRSGYLRLNPELAASDVEAFMLALERARAAHGLEQMAAAEEALALQVPGLLSRVARKRNAPERPVELYRWLGETRWERAAGRLDALGREAEGLLARVYRDAGRHVEARALFAGLLAEDPLDRRARGAAGRGGGHG